jgi:hypothetical protein
MRQRIGEKKCKKYQIKYNVQVHTEDLMSNPINSVNPDSKIRCLDNYNMETHQRKDDAATHRRKEV